MKNFYEVDVFKVVSHIENNTSFDAFNWFKRTTNSQLRIFIDVLKLRDFFQKIMPQVGFTFLLIVDYMLDV